MARRTALPLLGVLGILGIAPLAAAAPPLSGVNAVIGDESYLVRFGEPPDDTVDEDLRLRVHLEYVEDLLRAADTRGLSPERREARARNLDLLHAYHVRAVFPRNHAVPGRRPHFIDETGRICAVGHLAEHSLGHRAVEAINARFEWAYIDEIQDPAFLAWADGSGLTLRELAMIQPAYDDIRDPVMPPPGRRPPPPPPPRDDETRILVARVDQALRSLDAAVQDCADRIGVAE